MCFADRLLAKWLCQDAPATLTGGRAFFFLSHIPSLGIPLTEGRSLAISAQIGFRPRVPFKRNQLLAKTKPTVWSPTHGISHEPATIPKAFGDGEDLIGRVCHAVADDGSAARGTVLDSHRQYNRGGSAMTTSRARGFIGASVSRGNATKATSATCAARLATPAPR